MHNFIVRILAGFICNDTARRSFRKKYLHNNIYNKNALNILFAATSDFLPYALVTALSVIKNTKKKINFHFLYADIVKDISDYQRKSMFDSAKYFLLKYKNAKIFFYDVSDKMYLFDGQNIGMWGKEISMTHYMYLLAPIVLPDFINKVIYLDTDVIVNCDLKKIYKIKLKKPMLFAAPSGDESKPDTFNSGFSVINLKMWRKKNILNNVLDFGRNLPRCELCDQNLLNNYFDKKSLRFVSSKYNVFPQCHIDYSVNDMKILHFASLEHPFDGKKPWQAIGKRYGNLWWCYARKTPYYEMFLDNYFINKNSQL